jgi:hypothetical protein
MEMTTTSTVHGAADGAADGSADRAVDGGRGTGSMVDAINSARAQKQIAETIDGSHTVAINAAEL